jgi:hypothetical protein
MEKKKYNSPVIEVVILDNEISLALASAPPAGPYESTNVAPENFQNEPYKGYFA